MECLDDCHCGVDCHYCLEFVVKVWQSSVEHEGREVSTQSVIIEFLRASIVESVREDVVFKLSNVNRLQGSYLLSMGFDLLGNVDEDIVRAAQKYTITVEVLVGRSSIGFPSLAENVGRCFTSHWSEFSADFFAAFEHGFEGLEYGTEVNALMLGEFCTGSRE
jgi:hypothetical protein